MKHKAQEVLDKMLQGSKINHTHCSDYCVEDYPSTCGTKKCPQEREDTEDEKLLKEFSDCQLTDNELSILRMSIQGFCNILYTQNVHASVHVYEKIITKLTKQKEMWVSEGE